MITAENVVRDFAGVRALDGITFSVPRGTVTGLLGHNGAGKSTLVKILTTLLPPTSGRAAVAGLDVEREGARVRRVIAVAGQFASVDDELSSTENLVMIGRLLGARRTEARIRAAELITLFDLSIAGNRRVSTYSGGMRRRLDLAVSLVGRPEVLFLDEPTTGLDPVSRAELWSMIRGLIDQGTTALLTTQILPEAERLADHIVVLEKGRVIADGTPAELKAQVGHRSVRVAVGSAAELPRLAEAMTGAGLKPGRVDDRTLSARLGHTSEVVPIIETLGRAGVTVADLWLSEPTIDDAYLALAGGQSASTRVASDNHGTEAN